MYPSLQRWLGILGSIIIHCCSGFCHRSNRGWRDREVVERTTGGDPVRDYLFNRTWFCDHLIDSESWDGFDHSSFSTNCSLFCGCSGLGSSDSAKESEHVSCPSNRAVHHDDERLSWCLNLFDNCFSGTRLALKIGPSFCCPSANFGRIFGYSG